MTIIHYLHNNAETEAFGAVLFSVLPDKCLVFLAGQLGAGKTSLVRGFLRAAGHQGAVKSPTFTLVEEYQLNQRCIFHFDLYRLTSAEELHWIGMDDYLAQSAICFIEWAERGAGFLPPADVIIQLHSVGEGRELTLQADDSTLALLQEKTSHWKNNDILL
jgi:tRNA threonylcarbamoyladenosine biosynthesis protein TsaE